MSSALREVADLVRRESGIEVGLAQFTSLEAAVARVEHGMTPERLLATHRSDALIQRLLNEVTVRETFFFRHRRELEAIEWRRLLEVANARGSDVVRVWVAGCASGEEAYTLGILACEAFSTSTPPVRILATDIATMALEQAERGRYSPRSAAAIGGDLRRRYFTSQDGLLCVGERLRRLVEFRRQNLMRDLAPTVPYGGFDVISCRNVLIYFDPPTVDRVLRSLESALAPSGVFVLGAADCLSGRPTGGARPARSVQRRVPSISGGSRVPKEPVTRPRPAPSAQVSRPAEQRSLHEALAAADRGRLDLALEICAETLARDPLDADAYYVRGLAELARDDPRAAVASLRRAVYIDTQFSAALFKLARAHDALGSIDAARQAYERTLRSLARDADAPRELVHAIEVTDIAVACHARLNAFGTSHGSSAKHAA